MIGPSRMRARAYARYDEMGDERPAGPSSAALPGEYPKPELADVVRLGRHVVRRAVRRARQDDAPTLGRVIANHLGGPSREVPIVSEAWPPYEHVNVQIALDHWLAGRPHELIGIRQFEESGYGLAELLQMGHERHGPNIGNPTTINLPSGPGGQTYPCLRYGLLLVSPTDAAPMVMLYSGAGAVRIEAMCEDAAAANNALREIGELTLRHNVYRGQVVSFGGDVFGRHHGMLQIHERPALPRDHVILGQGMIERIEDHLVGVARHRSRLQASGQHLKRGLLLYGAPGTGKTHTVRYLLSQLSDVTAVILSGAALGAISSACSIARALQPALVIVEDVDLIAQDRGDSPHERPLLFTLLNELDGLGEDVDVAFVLTTNRVDMLEPALAMRPGRVDQAVELPVPDADARRRLLQLYGADLRMQVADYSPVIERTAGVTASFLKELVRRAALHSARADGTSHGVLTVTDAHLVAATDELLDQQNLLTRNLLGGARPTPGES